MFVTHVSEHVNMKRFSSPKSHAAQDMANHHWTALGLLNRNKGQLRKLNFMLPVPSGNCKDDILLYLKQTQGMELIQTTTLHNCKHSGT